MIDLKHGDCFNLIKELPDNCVDLIVTDPPYIVENHGGGKKELGNRKYYSELTNMDSGFYIGILDELCRVMKKVNIYIFCSKQQLTSIINYFEQKKCTWNLLAWHKTNPPPTCNNKYLNDTEYILFAREKGVKIYGEYATKKTYYVTPINKNDKKIYKHPTVKPIEIVNNFILNSSSINDVVLDPFMGSGTTGVACKNLGRSFIGFELDENYFNIAKDRINSVA